MSGLKTIISKELARVLKDKKMVFSMFILPVILVIGIMGLVFFLVNNMEKDVAEHTSVVYVQSAPQDFKAMLDSAENTDVHYIDAQENTDDILEQIREGDVDLLVEFPENFEQAVEDWEKNEIPQVKTFYNPSKDYSSEARNTYVSTYIEAYRQSIAVIRFGSYDAVTVFSVDTDNSEMVVQDDERAMGEMLGSFVPYFITMLIFAGAMGLGVDSIAGEKERGTIASLLLTPVKRVNIVLGKIIALSILSIISALTYIVGLVLALVVGINVMGEADTIKSMAFSLSSTQAIQLIVLIMGVVLLYVALIGLMSVLSKDNKEAQTYVMPLYLLVIVAGMMTMFSSGDTSTTSYMIPIFNTSVAFRGIFTQSITVSQYIISLAITYGCAAIVIHATAKAFKSERLMFNA